MFTGIIQETGVIEQIKHAPGRIRFSIAAPKSAVELSTNDSVSINGVCLTVTERAGNTFTVEAVEETLRKTTLGSLRESSRVNLELSMKLGDRVGGHIVLGHVDCRGTVNNIRKKEGSWLVEIGFPPAYSGYLVPVGSVAVDGISLTVATLSQNEFTVSIIPHTLLNTTLSEATVGTEVNLEFDVLGKYVESLLTSSGRREEPISREKLREWGFGA